MVPMVFPLIYTEAKGMESFVSRSITFPEIVICATRVVAKNKNAIDVRARMWGTLKMNIQEGLSNQT
jgi:hypothetical protein